MTPNRWRRLREVLALRQPDLTVLMDNVHKPHNLSAVLRTCDAVGVFQAHAVTDKVKLRLGGGTSSGSRKWVPVKQHASVDSAVAHLHADGFQILAAHLTKNAVDFRDIDYTRPTGVLLGAELHGVSAESLSLADHHVIIPMQGMVESLNVSVAAATILFEAQRQRLAAGMYETSRLDARTHARTLFEWAHPKVAAFCRAHALPYPAMDEEGEVINAPGALDTGPEEQD